MSRLEEGESRACGRSCGRGRDAEERAAASIGWWRTHVVVEACGVKNVGREICREGKAFEIATPSYMRLDEEVVAEGAKINEVHLDRVHSQRVFDDEHVDAAHPSELQAPVGRP